MSSELVGLFTMDEHFRKLHGCVVSQAAAANDAEVFRRLQSAVETLIDRDRYLLEKDVNERSISHKLACYLALEFSEWDVDCEYNRNHDNAKTLDLYPEQIKSDDANGTTVFPDIIIHKRGLDENFIVIEIKKSTNTQGAGRDFGKFRAFKGQLGRGLGVRLGIFGFLGHSSGIAPKRGFTLQSAYAS